MQAITTIATNTTFFIRSSNNGKPFLLLAIIPCIKDTKKTNKKIIPTNNTDKMKKANIRKIKA